MVALSKLYTFKIRKEREEEARRIRERERALKKAMNPKKKRK